MIQFKLFCYISLLYYITQYEQCHMKVEKYVISAIKLIREYNYVEICISLLHKNELIVLVT